MTRFNLDDLPLCGAKTRGGTPCKRKGSKANGRCRLHGGRSTGPKTQEGKLKTRRNANKDIPFWGVWHERDPKLVEDARTAFDDIYEHINEEQIDWDAVIKVVKKYRIALEANKYTMFTSDFAAEGLLYIQSALDQYYQEMNSDHLAFHVYQPQLPFRGLGKKPTKPQEELMEQWRKKNPWPPWEFDNDGRRVIFHSKQQLENEIERQRTKSPTNFK
ncbi:HGGxSTG domain-containing protein [Vibrio astriarenae]